MNATVTIEETVADANRRARANGHKKDPLVIFAEKAESGRIYKFWSEQLGRICKGELLTWGRGPYRDFVFFRGEATRARDEERTDGSRTVVVGVHREDNVKKVPARELGEW